MTSTPESCRAALAYARRGWAVLPIVARGKTPLTTHGFHDASVDPATVRSWWSTWPAANVGVVTGAGSGLVVIDIDGDAGYRAFLDVQRWMRRAVPPTFWVHTGGGGWHAYFSHPGGHVPSTVGRICERVDTRADGGYVVAPPSIHPNGLRYEAFADVPLTPLPGWLLDLMFPTPPTRQRLRLVTITGTSPYAAAALQQEAATVAAASIGCRNHRLNRSAFVLGTLVGAGLLDEDIVRNALVVAGCAAGLGKAEAGRTIASGMAAGIKHPRAVAS